MALAEVRQRNLVETEHSCVTDVQVFAMRLHAQAHKAEAQKAQMQSSLSGNNVVDDGVHGFARHNGPHGLPVVQLPNVPSACSWHHENGIRRTAYL
ncbi:hypothetical protein FKW15_08375 [Acetobacter sp. DmW_125133]|uniref:Uncharacterized protein n=2 Tax=Acetobacter TaxID=434 RepID=A0AAN1U8J6_9PROT|nr:hypothetical protein CBI36_10280 [Acetobacter oryzifermentans]AXM99885.1 hypothetical protein CJF59_04520 [Acetobacter pomorum]KAA8393428.1 hypothetical protein FKW22_12050 [Acetobacter sp. DmW_125124]KAA8394888.1 hypothetical protein FKW20_12525 [Acetobacter sp. DmW_125127]KAA8398343.1 hypothetical protein FKW19_04575 [Acetobacter sp. DmW_125128]KAA8405232.1 hypothetical protein FKW15_08375 [Acetobacter sp. DmW_125133]KAA8405628.1 hypothetical protein FKW32_05325 [Acetobacter sp. DmW_1251